MSVLVATDLDRTLIYSTDAVTAHGDGPEPLVPVERYRDADASWMTAAASAGWAALSQLATVLPVTTRTPEQWQRIHLPGAPPSYAVTANGGILLVDGGVDARWQATVCRRLTEGAPLASVLAHAMHACRAEWTVTVRNACDLFCYAVLLRDGVPDGFVAGEQAWAREHGWVVSLQGRKLYWVPRSLTKSAAVAEVARRIDASTVLAAGDSLLDADLLVAADRGIAARHGELVASGWRHPSVVVTDACGIRAGAEIVDWFAEQVQD